MCTYLHNAIYPRVGFLNLTALFHAFRGFPVSSVRLLPSDSSGANLADEKPGRLAGSFVAIRQMSSSDDQGAVADKIAVRTEYVESLRRIARNATISLLVLRVTKEHSTNGLVADSGSRIC